MRLMLLLLVAALSVAACGGDADDTSKAGLPTTTVASRAAVATTVAADAPRSTTTAVASADELFPDVVAADVTRASDGTFSFDVTISSPYDTPDRYADAWRIVGPDGEVLGVRELLHDHAGEQPFTRSLAGVVIPEEVSVVVVEGRDQLNGWGGATVEVSVPQD